MASVDGSLFVGVLGVAWVKFHMHWRHPANRLTSCLLYVSSACRAESGVPPNMKQSSLGGAATGSFMFRTEWQLLARFKTR